VFLADCSLGYTGRFKTFSSLPFSSSSPSPSISSSTSSSSPDSWKSGDVKDACEELARREIPPESADFDCGLLGVRPKGGVFPMSDFVVLLC
jgi:hypothetical protein